MNEWFDHESKQTDILLELKEDIARVAENVSHVGENVSHVGENVSHVGDSVARVGDVIHDISLGMFCVIKTSDTF